MKDKITNINNLFELKFSQIKSHLKPEDIKTILEFSKECFEASRELKFQPSYLPPEFEYKSFEDYLNSL